MFLMIKQYAAIPGFNYIQLIQNPGFDFFINPISDGYHLQCRSRWILLSIQGENIQ